MAKTKSTSLNMVYYPKIKGEELNGVGSTSISTNLHIMTMVEPITGRFDSSQLYRPPTDRLYIDAKRYWTTALFG